MGISTIPTQYGTFTVNDNDTDTILVTGPASATFSYTIAPTPLDPGFTGDIYSVHAAAYTSAINFCLNYSREKDAFLSRDATETLRDTHLLLAETQAQILIRLENIRANLDILRIRGSDEDLGIVFRNTCTPCITEEALTISALRDSGKLDSVISQIKTGQTLGRLAGL